MTIYILYLLISVIFIILDIEEGRDIPYFDWGIFPILPGGFPMPPAAPLFYNGEGQVTLYTNG